MPYLDLNPDSTSDSQYGPQYSEAGMMPPPAPIESDEEKKKRLLAMLQGLPMGQGNAPAPAPAPPTPQPPSASLPPPPTPPNMGMGQPPPGPTPPPQSPDSISQTLDRILSTSPSRPIQRPDLGMGTYSDSTGTHKLDLLHKAMGMAGSLAGGIGGGLRGATLGTDIIDQPFHRATAEYTQRMKDRDDNLKQLTEQAKLRDQLLTSSQNRTQGAETHAADMGGLTAAGVNIPNVGHIPGTVEQDNRAVNRAAATTAATTTAAGEANLKLQIEKSPQTIKALIDSTKAKLAAANIQPDNPMYNAEMAKALGLTPQITLGEVMKATGVKDIPAHFNEVTVDAKTAADIISKQIDAKIAASSKISAAQIAAGVAAGIGAGQGAATGPGDTFGPKVASGEMKITDVPTKQRGAVINWMNENSNSIPKQLSAPGKQVMSSISLSKPIVDDLLAELEPHKTAGGTMSELVNRMKAQGSFLRYKAGLGADDTPEAKMNDDMTQLMSFMNVATIGQYLRGIRRYEFIKQVQQHLPQPGFTPAANYQRLLGLKNNVLPKLEAAVLASEQTSVTGGKMGAGSVNKPAATSSSTPAANFRYDPTTGTIAPITPPQEEE